MSTRGDLHDWRTASTGPAWPARDWKATIEDGETGSPLIEWHGPAEDKKEARALATHDARVILKAAAALCGAPDAFRGHSFKWPQVEPSDDAFGSTAFQVRQKTLEIIRAAGGTWPIPFPMPQERVDATAHAALMAAASRAILEPGSSIGPSYATPHDEELGNLPFAMVRIGVSVPGRHDAMELSGPLRSATVALTLAGQFAKRQVEPTIPDEEIPASATARAALRETLRRQAPERCERVAAFLRELGLTEEGEAFKEAYGQP